MTGITDMHLLITDTFKKKVDQKTSQYLECPPFASCSVTHLLRIELIRLLTVAFGMLSHSSSMSVSKVAGHWRELEHAVIHVDPEQHTAHPHDAIPSVRYT